MGSAELARPDPAGAAAEDAGLARVVVGRGERWSPQQGVALLQRAGERVEGRELERLLGGQVGKDRGDPLGERGLAASLGAGQQQVVPAGGGDLDGEAGVVDARRRRPCRPRRAAARRARPAAGCPTSVRPEAPAGPPRRRARRPPGRASARRAPRRRAPAPPRGPGARGRRPGGCPGGTAASTIGSTPGTARRPPVRVSSPMKTEPVTSARAELAVALSTASAIARSKWVPRLGRSLGREQDRDPLGRRPVQSGVVDGHPAPVRRLVDGQRRAAPPGSGRPGPARRRPGRRRGGRWRRRARWSGVAETGISRSPARARPARGPCRAAAPPPGRPGSPAGSPHGPRPTATPSRCSRASLASVIASWGEPCSRLVRVLTSQTTSAGPSRSTRSISPSSQRQLRSSSTIPRASRWSVGHPLAVAPERLVARPCLRHRCPPREQRRGRCPQGGPSPVAGCGEPASAVGCGRQVAQLTSIGCLTPVPV